jgi:hypothetical protein
MNLNSDLCGGHGAQLTAWLIVRAARRFSGRSVCRRAEDFLEQTELFLKGDAHFAGRSAGLGDDCLAAPGGREVKDDEREPDGGQSGPSAPTRPDEFVPELLWDILNATAQGRKDARQKRTLAQSNRRPTNLGAFAPLRLCVEFSHHGTTNFVQLWIGGLMAGQQNLTERFHATFSSTSFLSANFA